MKYSIEMSGMGCAHCINRVSNALDAIGAKVVSVELNKAIIDYGDDVACIKEAVEDLGFELLSINKLI